MKVSVCMTTYNHKRFIAQAIESVVAQQTAFDYELVIGEDCSTDGTREVCLSYQRRYPDKIRLLLHEKNLGMIRNYAQTFTSCKAQYVAMLDGDDYWTTPHKLQKQVDFLDAHPDYAICFARTEAFVEDGMCEPYCLPPPDLAKETYTIEDLLQGNMIGNSSVMYRNGLVEGFPAWFLGLDLSDWPLHILIAQHGKLGYLDDVMAAYRIHGNSGYSSRDPIARLLVEANTYRAVSVHLGKRYRNLMNERLAWYYQRLAIGYLRKRDRPKAIRHALLSVRILPFRAYSRRLSPRVVVKALRMIGRKT